MTTADTKQHAFRTLILALSLAGCMTQGADEQLGDLELGLRVPASGEGQYRLANATFVIRSGNTVVESFQDSSSILARRVALSAGDYTIELGGTWYLELDFDGTTYSAGDFEVDGPNPAPFTIADGRSTPVTFAFKRSGSVSVGIEAPARRVSAYLYVSDAGGQVPQGSAAVVVLDMSFAPPTHNTSYQTSNYDATSSTLVATGDSGLTNFFANATAKPSMWLRYNGSTSTAELNLSLPDGWHLRMPGTADVPVGPDSFPIAAPFCVTSGYFWIRKNYEADAASGVADWCLE